MELARLELAVDSNIGEAFRTLRKIKSWKVNGEFEEMLVHGMQMIDAERKIQDSVMDIISRIEKAKGRMATWKEFNEDLDIWIRIYTSLLPKLEAYTSYLANALGRHYEDEQPYAFCNVMSIGFIVGDYIKFGIRTCHNIRATRWRISVVAPIDYFEYKGTLIVKGRKGVLDVHEEHEHCKTIKLIAAINNLGR